MQQENLLEKFVLSQDLCSGCGTCAGVCPQDCIVMGKHGFARLMNKQRCTGCNLCYQCCPSAEVTFQTADPCGGGEYDLETGVWRSFFRGHAVDDTVRKNGASGGVATAIMQYLLDRKVVDAVICAKLHGHSACYQIIHKSEDLLETQKSYYVPVPLNLVIGKIKDTEKKYAVTGTPCQIQGLVKAMEVIPDLKKRIVYKIGLFCGYMQREEGVHALAGYLGCDSAEWEFCGWRCGDYPGYTVFKNKHTGERTSMIIYDALSLAVPFFTPRKCFLCPDGTNTYADIALGDIHGAGADENVGIVRTKAGQELLSAATGQGYMECEEETAGGEVYKIVKGVTASKYRLVWEQIALSRKKGERVPVYHNLNAPEKQNIIMHIFYKRKAKLYAWALAKGQNTWSGIPPERFMKIGKYIYQYPASSVFFRMIVRLRNAWRKR